MRIRIRRGTLHSATPPAPAVLKEPVLRQTTYGELDVGVSFWWRGQPYVKMGAHIAYNTQTGVQWGIFTDSAVVSVGGTVVYLATFGELQIGTVFNFRHGTYIKGEATSAQMGKAHLVSDVERFILMDNNQVVYI